MAQADKNRDYMKETWGTEFLATDYGSIESLEAKIKPITSSEYTHGFGFLSGRHKQEQMLREISHDDITPKKHNFDPQNELHEKIRNDEDYDDWEYGTEPLPMKNWK